MTSDEFERGASTDAPLVYSVVVNYQSPEDTKRCLDSLTSLDYPNHEIVVVNNHNNFEGTNTIREAFPSCTVIATGENLGFSSGFNVGIRYALAAGAEFVSILNDDTILHEEFLNAGVRAFERGDNVGIVGGKIYKYDDGRTDNIWTAGGKMSWIRAQGVGYGFNEKDRGQFDEETEVEFVPGSQMLVCRDVFEKVGLLPEVYFLGGEEWDFCQQVRDSGFQIRYVPDAILWHEIGHTAEETYIRYYNLFRNKFIFTRRHYSKLGRLLWIGLFIILLHTYLIYTNRNNWQTVYAAGLRALYMTARKGSEGVTRQEYERHRSRSGKR
jgi:GT2 family glycosyltransferase